jgi:hypothetical protein
MPRRKPVSVVVVEETEGRFLVLTYADGTVAREAVDPKRKPARRPRRPPQRLIGDRLNRTRQKSY